MLAGVYRLYSVEYYRQVLDHLTERGMMTQWLPVYQMPEEAVHLALRAFVQSFPHSLLLAGFENEYILVGAKAPFDFRETDPATGKWLESSAKFKATTNCIKATTGQVQKRYAPRAAIPTPNKAKIPVDGEM